MFDNDYDRRWHRNDRCVGSKQRSRNHDEQRQSSRWQRRSDGSLSIELPRWHRDRLNVWHRDDSIAVSMFVLVLVDLDKYWDEQASSNSLSNTNLHHFQNIISLRQNVIFSTTETQSRREWGMYRRPFSPKLGVSGSLPGTPRPI